jgi:integrase
VEKLRGKPLYTKVIISLFTGMRRAEILGLRWRHIDLDAKVITVREAVEETNVGVRLKEPKSKAGKRDITLPDIVVDTLRDYQAAQTAARARDRKAVR